MRTMDRTAGGLRARVLGSYFNCIFVWAYIIPFLFIAYEKPNNTDPAHHGISLVDSIFPT